MFTDQGCTGYPAGQISGLFWYPVSGRISGETVEQMMRTLKEKTFFQHHFNKYKIRVKQRPEISKKNLKKKSLFTIQPDIRYPAKPDVRYPAKLLAGYPAKLESSTTLLLTYIIYIYPINNKTDHIWEKYIFYRKKSKTKVDIFPNLGRIWSRIRPPWPITSMASKPEYLVGYTLKHRKLYPCLPFS